MADVTKFTNQELVTEMVNNTLGLKADCATEMVARMSAVNVQDKKGFEHPNDPPPNP